MVILSEDSTKLNVSSNEFNVWENGQNIQIENF